MAMAMGSQDVPSSEIGTLMLDSGLVYSFDNPFGL